MYLKSKNKLPDKVEKEVVETNIEDRNVNPDELANQHTDPEKHL